MITITCTQCQHDVLDHDGIGCFALMPVDADGITPLCKCKRTQAEVRGAYWPPHTAV